VIAAILPPSLPPKSAQDTNDASSATAATTLKEEEEEEVASIAIWQKRMQNTTLQTTQTRPQLLRLWFIAAFYKRALCNCVSNSRSPFPIPITHNPDYISSFHFFWSATKCVFLNDAQITFVV
jgi:hypothetical protein